MSYNEIQRLDGLSALVNLKTLYLSNNLIGMRDGGKFDELNKIVAK